MSKLNLTDVLEECTDELYGDELLDYEEHVTEVEAEAEAAEVDDDDGWEPSNVPFPDFVPGRITYALLRRIVQWEAIEGLSDVTYTDLDYFREEGHSPSVAALRLGLLDYGQVSGETD